MSDETVKLDQMRRINKNTKTGIILAAPEISENLLFTPTDSALYHQKWKLFDQSKMISKI